MGTSNKDEDLEEQKQRFICNRMVNYWCLIDFWIKQSQIVNFYYSVDYWIKQSRIRNFWYNRFLYLSRLNPDLLKSHQWRRDLDRMKRMLDPVLFKKIQEIQKSDIIVPHST